MASEQTCGSTVRELMDEIARLKAEYTAAIVERNQLRVDRDAWQKAANLYSDQLTALAADNERLSARAARLEVENVEREAELIYLRLYGKDGARWSANESKDVWREKARRELEEGHD